MKKSYAVWALFFLGFILPATSVSAASSLNMKNAKKLYERITGVKVNSSRPELQEIAQLLASGQQQAAVRKILDSKDFINVQVRNMALRLSNRDESVKVGFSDFAALIVGTVRDNRDFRGVLNGDYYYDLEGVNGADDPRNRYFSASYYSNTESNYVDLMKALVFKPTQKMIISGLNTSTTVADVGADKILNEVVQTDAAGVLTTRAFAERNLTGGTNRRAVEFSLKQFLCVSMADAADANASDQFVGKDVERFPAGDHNKYLTSCKSCHAVMDAMRPAFAKYDYVNYEGSGDMFTIVNGDIQTKQGAPAKDLYINTVFNPTIEKIIPDLEANQDKSIYYNARYNYMIGKGSTAAAATEELTRLLNTVRDTNTLNTEISRYRNQNVSAMASIRTNITTNDAKNRYSQECLNHLLNAALSADDQESKFLTCELDKNRENSFLYMSYNASLVSSGVATAEMTRLLNKFMNRDRDVNGIVDSYLRIQNESRFFASNAFDGKTGVTSKVNKGSYNYGFTVTSDNFVNNANLGSKASFFGWRGPAKAGGTGLKAFGTMLADSRRFSQCMAKRTYESVCIKKLDSSQQSLLIRLGDRFEALGYDLKSLFGEIALDKSCGIIQEGAL